MEEIRKILETQNLITALLILSVIIFIIFIPGMVALFRNPKRAKLIFVACIPSFFSFWLWLGLLVWAISGKEFQTKLNNPFKKK